MPMTTQELAASIQKGIFKPHIYLTNVCLSYFQSMSGFVARRVFPIVPVPTSSAHYYEFDKGDLARDNMARKPEFRRSRYLWEAGQVLSLRGRSGNYGC